VFNTDDMAATIEFYCEVLGLRLVHVARTPSVVDQFGAGEPPVAGIRHYFFDMGHDSTIAFFEYPKGTPKGDRDALGTMQHCALHVSRADFAAAMGRLKAHGVSFVGPVDRVIRHSIYLYDNNGIRLEFTTWPEGEDFSTVDSLFQAEADARRELATLYDNPADLERVLKAMPLR